jgi:thiol-disulfide isomerase/thioredoxin
MSDSQGILERLRSATLQRKDGTTVDGAEALEGKRVVLFFSAEWCPHCVTFLPTLTEFYDASAAANNFEIVFVSSDPTPEAQAKYLEHHGNWLALPVDNELTGDLKVRLFLILDSILI